MDAQALENEALSAIEAAETLDALERLRVRFLGRKSELKLALREVRDRETGMALNAVRERLEAAVDERQASLERAGRLDATDGLDVTLPGERRRGSDTSIPSRRSSARPRTSSSASATRSSTAARWRRSGTTSTRSTSR